MAHLEKVQNHKASRSPACLAFALRRCFRQSIGVPLGGCVERILVNCEGLGVPILDALLDVLQLVFRPIGIDFNLHHSFLWIPWHRLLTLSFFL